MFMSGLGYFFRKMLHEHPLIIHPIVHVMH